MKTTTEFERYKSQILMSKRGRCTYSKRLQEICKYLEPKSKVLDIGCGFGSHALDIAKDKNCFVVGVDLNLERLSIANDRSSQNDNALFIMGNATKLPFKDKEFDYVILSEFIHHIREILPQILLEIRRVLSNGGKLIIADHNKESFLLRLICALKIDKTLSREYPLFYTVSELQDYLTSTGYKILEWRYIIFVPPRIVPPLWTYVEDGIEKHIPKLCGVFVLCGQKM